MASADKAMSEAGEKLCVFCKWFGWEKFDYTYYSTLTGGDLYGGMSCEKGHYNEMPYDKDNLLSDINPDDTDDFRRVILTATNCIDYSPPTKDKHGTT